MIKINDIIRVEASAYMGCASSNARVYDFSVLGERDLPVDTELNVIDVEFVDGDAAGYRCCVTESSPHYVVDDDFVASLVPSSTKASSP